MNPTVKVRPARRLAAFLAISLFAALAGLRGQTILSGSYNAQGITGDIQVNSNVVATFLGGTTFSGANVNLVGPSSWIYWQQVGTLSGKAFTLGSGSGVYVIGVNNSLTLDAATTATGTLNFYSDGSSGVVIANQGTLTHTAGTGYLYAATLNNSGTITANAGTLFVGSPSGGYNTFNSGTITADGSGTTVYIRGNFNNTGTLVAQNSGILRFDGTNTSANLGTVQIATNGRALLTGTINNAASTLPTPTGGVFELVSGTITGGNVSPASLQFTTSGGYLNGVSLTGNLDLSTAGSYVYFQGGTSFTGATANLANSAFVYWQQAGTLTGKALTIGSGAGFYLSGTNSALTLDAATTATGYLNFYADGSANTSFTNLGNLTHNGSSASIYATNITNAGTITATAGTLYFGYPSAGYSGTNSGSLVADGSGTTIYVRGSINNTGTITAQNSGVLRFDGTTSSSNLNGVAVTGGGHAYLTGSVANASSTLPTPTTGKFELLGGTISGGTVAPASLQFTSGGGYLSGVTVTGNLDLSTNYTYVYFQGGTDFTGTTASFGTGSWVYWQQAGTLTGKSLGFTSGGGFYLVGANSSLTLDAATTATGNQNFYSDGSANTSFTNLGSLAHTGGTGSIYASTITNAGTITATAGTLYFGYPSAGYTGTNSGSLVADGSGTTVYVRGSISNPGTMTAQNSGVLRFDGATSSSNLGGVVIASSGRALLNGSVDNTSSTLPSPTGGVFELYGGTITGGTVGPASLGFTSSGGTLSAVTYSGDLSLATGSYVYFANGALFTGTNAMFANSAWIYWQQAATLAGKSLTFGSGSGIYLVGTNSSLTLDAATTSTGFLNFYADGSANTSFTNLGTLTNTGSSSSIYASLFTNSGSITALAGTLYLGYPSAGYNSVNTGSVVADGSGTTVYVRGNFDNNGTITAQNSGIVRFDGTTTAANLGSVVLASGGRALLSGTVDNTVGTVPTPTGGAFELAGGTIAGGTLTPAAVTFTSSSGYLNGVTIAGDLGLTNSSAAVYFQNGTTFTGANASLANYAYVYWQQAGTLTGKTITTGLGSSFYLVGANSTLVLDPTTTVTGSTSFYSDGSANTSFTNQGTINHTGSSASMYAATFVNDGTILATGGTLYLGTTSAGYNAFNLGTVTADGSGTSVYLNGNFTNTGTLIAQNSGLLRFSGNNVTANLGAIQVATGGRVLLSGTLDNTADTLTPLVGGLYELYGGTINGGTIASGALAINNSGGTLNGVTLNGDFSFGTGGGYVYWLGGTNFTGSNAVLGSNNTLYWEQAGSLVAKTVTMGSGSSIYVNAANATLTLDAATTVTGTTSIYTDSSAGVAITNLGTITHTGGNGSLYGRSFTNSGAITATGGNLYLGYNSGSFTFANPAGGLLTTNGGNMLLQAPLTNQGTVNVQSGTFYAGTYLTNGSTGTIMGSGTINGNLTMAGGTLAPGNSIGTLTFQNSTFLVTAPASLVMEVNGASADRITFTNPTATVDLGAGILSLNLQLLGAPTPGTTYTLLNVSGGTFGITGSFAGLPNSGDLISATYASQTYTFAVNYLATSVTMDFQAVPEPSTYALLAAGLGVLGLGVRRRLRR